MMTVKMFKAMPSWLICFGKLDLKLLWKVRSEDLVKASNMVIGCAMEGNEQASVRGFVMVEIVLSMIIFDDR